MGLGSQVKYFKLKTCAEAYWVFEIFGEPPNTLTSATSASFGMTHNNNLVVTLTASINRKPEPVPGISSVETNMGFLIRVITHDGQLSARQRGVREPWGCFSWNGYRVVVYGISSLFH